MQTLEAILSFLFFFMFATYTLSQMDYTKPNYELYRYQLANDIWRCLYLTGDLSYYPPAPHFVLENKLKEIYDGTGLCVYLQGVRTTIRPDCTSRGGGCSEDNITMKKIWFEVFQPDVMTFTVCTPK